MLGGNRYVKEQWSHVFGNSFFAKEFSRIGDQIDYIRTNFSWNMQLAKRGKIGQMILVD